VKETAQLLREHNMKISTCVVLLDREQGAKQNLIDDGINVISIFPISRVLETLLKHKRINSVSAEAVRAFITNNQTNGSSTPVNNVSDKIVQPENMPLKTRSELTVNAVNKRLLETMMRNESNLCVAIDKTKSADILELVKKVGKYVAVVKLHSDIVEDWSLDVQQQLKGLSKDLDFLLFEDRKLADIGNTVKHQTAGISSWADLLTVHGLPGPGLLQGVQAGSTNQIGVLLVAEMSNAGNLFNQEYTKAVVNMGEQKKVAGLVSGFISQSRVSKNAGLVQMTPGVHLAESSDSGDQRYTSPAQAVQDKGADLIIVGRGICEATSPEIKAEEYRLQGWQAYLNNIKQ